MSTQKQIATRILPLVLLLILGNVFTVFGQQPVINTKNKLLQDLYFRNFCIFPDPVSKTYYMIDSDYKSIVAYSSKDLIHWDGPHTIFNAPPYYIDSAHIIDIVTPELHAYNGKYYLFLTLLYRDTYSKPGQYPHSVMAIGVRRRQILVSDSLIGQFKPFQNRAPILLDGMNLDGSIWIEDGKPFIVYNAKYEFLNGTVKCMSLKGDLSEVTGSATLLFKANEGTRASIMKAEGCNIHDGPFLYKSKSGKLMMVWKTLLRSVGYPELKNGDYFVLRASKYSEGIAISESGKLFGPWVQQVEPILNDDGGNVRLFSTFEGKPMIVMNRLHNKASRPHIFEIEDTGNTLRIGKEFK